jgi:hypothetical protein
MFLIFTHDQKNLRPAQKDILSDMNRERDKLEKQKKITINEGNQQMDDALLQINRSTKLRIDKTLRKSQLKTVINQTTGRRYQAQTPQDSTDPF